MKRGRVSAKSIQNESENNSRENDEIYQKAKQLKIVEESRQHEQIKSAVLPDKFQNISNVPLSISGSRRQTRQMYVFPGNINPKKTGVIGSINDEDGEHPIMTFSFPFGELQFKGVRVIPKHQLLVIQHDNKKIKVDKFDHIVLFSEGKWIDKDGKVGPLPKSILEQPIKNDKTERNEEEEEEKESEEKKDVENNNEESQIEESQLGASFLDDSTIDIEEDEDSYARYLSFIDEIEDNTQSQNTPANNSQE